MYKYVILRFFIINHYAEQVNGEWYIIEFELKIEILKNKDEILFII